jgi:membrane-bound serine protease (ClpP class)
VVRRWSEPGGQVFINGALWRARQRWADSDDNESLREGDLVVVERVTGLTLSVRRAEEWELIE